MSNRFDILDKYCCLQYRFLVHSNPLDRVVLSVVFFNRQHILFGMLVFMNGLAICVIWLFP